LDLWVARVGPNCFRVSAYWQLSEKFLLVLNEIRSDERPLVWLKSSADTAESVKILEQNASATDIALGQIYYGPSLALKFNNPTEDSRTPDIIVTPTVGVTYSGSKSKLVEHDGFAHDDTNVVLLVSHSSFQPRTVRAEVGTAQVVPTILKALRLDPRALDAVRVEGTSVLPALSLQ
jgi:hypothetical protein